MDKLGPIIFKKCFYWGKVIEGRQQKKNGNIFLHFQEFEVLIVQVNGTNEDVHCLLTFHVIFPTNEECHLMKLAVKPSSDLFCFIFIVI